MSNLYTQQGVDFDSWFGQGSNSENFYIFTDTGQDVGQVYKAGSGGPESGFKIADGSDLNTKLGGYGFGLYRIAGAPWNYNPMYKNYSMSAQTNYWLNWLKSWRKGKGGVKCVNGITNDACYYPINSNFSYSQLVFAYNPDQTQTMKFTYSWGGKEVIGGWPNLSDIWCGYIEVDEWLKGIVIRPANDSGTIIRQVCSMSLSCAGQDTVKYTCLYGAANDSNQPESNTSGGGWSHGGYYFHA